MRVVVTTRVRPRRHRTGCCQSRSCGLVIAFGVAAFASTAGNATTAVPNINDKIIALFIVPPFDRSVFERFHFNRSYL
jgi:hypothetical protein